MKIALKWRIILFIGIIGIAFAVSAIPDWMCLQKSAKDITELWDVDYKQIKVGDHVCMDVTLVWDQIGTQIEESKTFGVTTSSRETGRYYLIPFCQDVEGGLIYPTPYLLTRLPGKYNSAMDDQISKTETWWETDGEFKDFPVSSVHLDGKIEKLPNDIRKQLEATLSPGELLDDYMLPVLFVPITNPGASKTMSIVGILLIMVDLVILFIVLKGAAGNNAMPTYGASPDYGGAAASNAGSGMAGNGNAAPGPVPFGSAFSGSQNMSQGQTLTGNQTAPQGQAFMGNQTAPQGQTFMGNQTASQGQTFMGNQTASQGPAFMGNQTTSQGPAFAGNPGASQPQSSPYSTATLETTPIPYIPGISLGPAPGQTAQQTGPSASGPVSMPGSMPLGPSGVSGPSQQSGPQPLGPSSITESDGQTVSLFGNTSQPSSSILGSAPQSSSSILGSASQPSSSILGSAPQSSSSILGSASQPSSSILGSAPQSASSILGSASQPLGPSSITESEDQTVSLFGSASQSSSSILGSAPQPESSISGDTPQTSSSETDEDKRKQEEMAKQIAAMSFGNSQPAMLPLGGAGANVQASSQPATLPLGVSPAQFTGGSSFTMPPAQPESSAAPTTSPAPSYGSAPAASSSPLYGSAPAASPVQSTKKPVEDENAPLYADNTEMKSVFQNAFAHPGNNGNNS